MFPCQADLDFYEALHEPAWVVKMRAADKNRRPRLQSDRARKDLLIDRVINSHGGRRVTSGECASANLMVLAASCIRRTPEALADYLESIAQNPQCVISPKRRAGFARKWARKLRERQA